MTSRILSRIGIAVVGYGYWGPNLVRNILERPEFRLQALCERLEARTAEFSRRHPDVRVEREYNAILDDPTIDAVCIATPPLTHYELARAALEAGKHVLVEKPMAKDGDEALDLIELARERNLVLMPGHTFVYSPPVNKVRELIADDVLGEIYFVTSSRMNLGVYQADGVILDLAPHDLSILLYWLGRPVTQVTATGSSVFREDVNETAFLTFTFEGGTKANVQISWLAPRKVREMVVVGSKRMVHYEDTAADESVRVYDRGLDLAEPSNFGEYRMTYRTGDMIAPRIEAIEPLSEEVQDYADAIIHGREPRSNAALGLQIVLALNAAEESLRRHGEPVRVPTLSLAGSVGGSGGSSGMAGGWDLRSPI